VVQQIQKLVQFLFGDFEGALAPDGLEASNPNVSRFQRAQQLFVRTQGDDRVRQLIPVLREYSPQLREFGSLLIVRLTEKGISRGLNWATSRVAARA
jgi:hypothetical protein